MQNKIPTVILRKIKDENELPRYIFSIDKGYDFRGGYFRLEPIKDGFHDGKYRIRSYLPWEEQEKPFDPEADYRGDNLTKQEAIRQIQLRLYFAVGVGLACRVSISDKNPTQKSRLINLTGENIFRFNGAREIIFDSGEIIETIE